MCAFAGAWLLATPSAAHAALPTITLVSPPGTSVGAYPGTSSIAFRFSVQSDSDYVQAWFKNGAAITASGKYGIGVGELVIRNLDFEDEGFYYLEVTNTSGTRRSVVITLRILEFPPDPVITTQPESASLAYGDRLYLSVGLQTSGAYLYRWYKDDVAIPSANRAYYQVVNATKADAGSYHVVVSAPTASVKSQVAVVTVADPLPPTIAVQPRNLDLEYGGWGSVSVEANGSLPMTFRLYRNGVVVAEQPGGIFWFQDATPEEDDGAYAIEVTNVAGKVVSNAFSIKVAPPAPPAITLSSGPVTLPHGSYLNLNATVTGSSPITMQWYKDGVPIKEGTMSSMTIPNATEEYSGIYTLKATNVAGTVTSSGLTVTISAPVAPTITSSFNVDVSTYVGAYLGLSYQNVTGSGPLTYTWYKDGVVVQTGSSYFTKHDVTLADAGTYWLEVTSPYGSATGHSFYVEINTSSGSVSVRPQYALHEGVVYVVPPNSSQLRRYNLATGEWLAPVSLGFVPRGLAVNQHGLFAGSGRALQRFSLAIDNPVNVRNFESDVRELVAGTKHLFVATGDYVYPVIQTLDYTDGSIKGTFSAVYSLAQNLVLSADGTLLGGRDMGISPSDIYRLPVNADGTFGTVLSSPYHGDYAVGNRFYFTDGGTRLIENSGVIYKSTDLTFAGSIAGAFTDMLEIEPGRQVVVRGRRATVYVNGAPSGFHDFSSTSAFLIRHGERIVSFSATTSGGFTTESVALADLDSELPLMPVVAPQRRVFRPHAVEFKDDLLYLYDRSAGNVHVFDVESFQYMDSIPLLGRPSFFRVDGTNGGMYTAYSDGSIWRMDLDPNLRERFLTVLATAPAALMPIGNFLFANDSSGAWSTNYTFDAATGRQISSDDWSYHGLDYLWNPARSRLFFLSTSVSPSDLQFITIGADGVLGATGDSPYHGSVLIANPVRMNPAGGLVLTGAGTIFDAVTLSSAGSLGNAFVDAVWTSSTIASIRRDDVGTEIQLWSPNTFTLTKSTKLPGEPLRIFALGGDRFLVLALVDGVPTPTVVTAALEVEATLVPLTADLVRSQPNRVVALGTAVVLDALSDGGPAGATFVWRRDGVIIEGARGRLLDLGTLSADEAGAYAVTVSHGGLTVVSNTFWVGPEPQRSYLVNVSTRSYTQGGSKTLIMGFALTGTGSKPLLMRTAGPALTRYGVSGVLADPMLGIYSGQDPIGTNDNWQDTSSYLTVGRRALNLGAFGFPNQSKDSAELMTFGPGGYTVHASSAVAGGAGVVLAEVYDADSTLDRLTGLRIANFSGRTEVRTGDDVLILGFVIGGNMPMRLLVRGIGPGLKPHGVTDALPDPKIEVFQGRTKIAENDNWGGTSELSQTFRQLGAFSLPVDSLDAAIITTLQPGSYTVVVRGVNDVTGVALAELYKIE
jgi:hypothetical protein